MESLNTISNEGSDEWLARYADLFDSIESTPLTQEQRLACVSNAPATLVLAGAGTGKTSTLTGRAAFLMAHNLAQPAEILCLAFAREAALEMNERLQRRLAARWPIQGFTASTFHSLGLHIVREVEGSQPVLTELCNSPRVLADFIHQQMRRRATHSAEYASLLFEYFAIIEPELVLACTFTERKHYLRACSVRLLQTIQGEIVCTPFDCLVANALCLMGVEYEYRKHYPHPVFLARRRPYRSTFYLPAADVYIDVFDCLQPANAQSPTAALSRRLAGIHQNYDTRHIILWEAPDYMADIWRLPELLHRQLIECTEPARMSTDEKRAGRVGIDYSQSRQFQSRRWRQRRYCACLQPLFDSARFASLADVLVTILPHYLQSTAPMSADTQRPEQKTAGPRCRISLVMQLMQPLAAAYKAHLVAHGEIDFDDMIARATQYVEHRRFIVPWREILIDEFQDISEARFALIAAMQRQRPDLRLFCVGDDWQAIYRFAGSEIKYSTQFSEYVHPHARIVPLSRTFRFSQSLCEVSSRFLMKNPFQNRKQLHAANTDIRQVITVARQQDGLAVILSGLQLEQEQYAGGGESRSMRRATVLILARFAHLLPDSDRLSAYTERYPGLQISASTVHASKGLEADYVLILNMSTGTYGFPSGRHADPVIEHFLPRPERFEHADERRLFYVALTRTRKHVWLLVPQDREKISVFVQELLRDNKAAFSSRGPCTAGRHLTNRQERPITRVVDKIKRYIVGLGICAEKKNRII